MMSLPRPHDTSPTAALVRVAALLLGLASVIVIPWTLIAAATHHLDAPTAIVTTAILGTVTLLANLAARSLDPLRG
jgi:hypothetical protein